MCVDCDGMGYIIDAREGDAGAPLVAKPCPRCGHAPGVPRPLWLARKDGLFEQQTALFNRVVDWIRSPIWSFTICAPEGTANFGTGKTHVLATFANEAHIRGYDVMFVNVIQLLERDHEARKSGGSSIIHTLASHRGILILDEFGVDNIYEREAIERMLRQRYDHRMRTLIASNVEWSVIGEHYPRLASALGEGIIVRWAGPDLRPQIKQRLVESHAV